MKILKVKDSSDAFHKKMKTFDLPFKILINGKSQLSGKTTIILNLLMNPQFEYNNLFEGKHIYIVSDNKLDNKLKLLSEFMEIPEGNIMSYNEGDLTRLYDTLEEDFLIEKADNDISNRLIIMDDIGYSGNLGKNKQFGIISKLVSNGRHLNLSQIYTSQRITMTSSTLRSNLTGLIAFNASSRELDIISEDFNYLDTRREFNKMFRDHTQGARDFIVLNFTGDQGLYYDKEFKPIKDLTR